MATVGEKLAAAQESGDLTQIQQTLMEAKAAGADPAQIDQALAEVRRLSGTGASTKDSASTSDSKKEASSTGEAEQDQAAAEAAAEAAAAEARARAEALKKKGNERLKESTKSGAREALDFFTDGIEIRCSDPVLNGQLYSNRAHVRMLLRQFVEAVDDCRKAIESDPKNIKAYWRGAKASMHLDLLKNGVEFCEAGLKQGPKDADLIRLRDSCAEKLSEQQKRRSEQASAPTKSEFNADEAMAVQEQVNSLTEQVESLKSSIMSKQRDQARVKLTKSIVSETPEETKLYTSMGRAFMLQERSVVEKRLSSSLESLDTELPKLLKTHQELEKRRESSEKELKEMIRSLQTHNEQAATASAH